jgi:hypothetical protein
MDSSVMELVGLIIGFCLTLMIFSYVIGDNFLFRIALAVFIGVASGYAAVLIVYNVIWYQLAVPLLTAPMDNLILTVPALLLGIWLLSKSSKRLARLGNPVLAFLVGVGAATAVGGAIFGTILPQVNMSFNLLNLQTAPGDGTGLAGWFLKSLLVLVGMLVTLAYFHFGIRPQGEGSLPQRAPWIENFVVPAGQAFIAITFGVLFAGVYMAALGALIDRVRFVWEFILRFLPL